MLLLQSRIVQALIAVTTLQVVAGLIPIGSWTHRISRMGASAGFSSLVAVRSPLVPPMDSSTSLNLVDPNSLADFYTTSAEAFSSSSTFLSFTDQGQNLAGIFFQASLLPYLIFIYFLQFRGNRLNGLSNFGFQYVLLFVLATIPSGIISKSVYGQTLANTDWLHGGAELLLTVANILIVSV